MSVIDAEVERLCANTPAAERTKVERVIRREFANWLELERTDPELFRLEFSLARTAKILAADHPSSPQYAQALIEDRQLRDERHALWTRRAAARVT